MSKRILLVASTTGYQTRAFAAAAGRLGYEVRLATDRCHVLEDPWGDQALPLRFDDPEWSARTVAANGGTFDGIVAVGDRPAYIAALIARQVGIPYNSPEAVLACKNKFLARERFRSAGLPVPNFVRIPVDADPAAAARAVRFPCVLKPLGLSASRGVIRVDDQKQFIAAFERIKDILASPEILRLHEDQDRYIQVEDFIEGREFALEGLLTGGQLTVLAIFDKPDPLNGPYFEETIYVTPSREAANAQCAIIDATARAIAALDLMHGPVHAEMRVNDRGVWMLEVAARPIGGLCAQALRFASGFSLEEVILRHAAGDPVGSIDLSDPARGVMMIPIPAAGIYAGVSGVDDARAVDGIEDVVITAKEGQKLLPLPEGASYLGFTFARGESPEIVERALREAHSRLAFEVLPALPVLR
jgi:biotin carboxylase